MTKALPTKATTIKVYRGGTVRHVGDCRFTVLSEHSVKNGGEY